MKYQISILVLLFGGTELFAQKLDANDVPVVVKNALEANTHVKDAQWDKEGANYEASYKSGGKEMSVVFDEQGRMLETEVEIGKNELPSLAKDLLKKEYSGYKVEEVARIIASNGEVTFEVEVEKLEKTFELIFDTQGKLVKQIEEKEAADKD